MQVVTIFGSNQGDKSQIIKKATEILSNTVGRIFKVSSFYETAPWGFESTENFLNQVVIFETELSPQEVLGCCLNTEKQLGRTRHTDDPRYSSRPIDIDILFYDSLILNSPDLILPHPRICERNFVLVPLAEIIPDFIHPTEGKTISTLLETSPDDLAVKLVDLK